MIRTSLLNLFNTLSLKKFKTKNLVQIAVEEQTRRQTYSIHCRANATTTRSSFIKHTYKTLHNKPSRYIATSITRCPSCAQRLHNQLNTIFRNVTHHFNLLPKHVSISFPHDILLRSHNFQNRTNLSIKDFCTNN